MSPLPVAALVAALCATAPAQAEEPVTLRYPPSDASWKVIVAGSGMFLGGYGLAAAMAGGFSDVPGADMAFIPVAGPFIALGQSGCAPTEESSPGQGDCGGMMALRGILFVLDGLLQVGSLGVVGEGIFMTTEAAAPEAPKAAVVPFVVGADSRGAPVGLSVVGSF